MLAALAAACGCGRPTLPGRYMEGKEVETSTAPKTTAPLPEKPYFELGPAAAKVRILVFFPMDDRHNDLVSLLKGLSKEYPDQVYVKYADPRTPEGSSLMQRSGMTSPGLLINNQSEIMINSNPQPYQVSFVQEMGRYWTTEDLRAAVAQTVAEVYGRKSAAER